MREIKFRIFLGGRFYYWGFVDGYFQGLPMSTEENLTSKEKKERSDQYIGLKDKNGKEIYEGDIIKHSNGTEAVEYFVNECILSGQPGYENSIHVTGFMFDENISEYEIIGNIYENPELIK